MTEAHLLIAVLLFSSLSFGKGGDSSGGGDPKVVQTVSFPDQKLLQDAIVFLQNEIGKTKYPETFKAAFIKELSQLQKDQKFLFVPELASLGYRRYPGDYKKLFSVGAFTGFAPGEPIYFSKQVIAYDSKKLARVIAQEIPHHILPSELRFDEDFVNPLGESLASGTTDSKLNKKLKASYLIADSSVVCKGEVWREDFSTGNRNPVFTGYEVELKFKFDLEKAKQYKTWDSEKAFELQTSVEEKVFEKGISSEGISPIIHKDIVLRTTHSTNQYLVYGLNLSLGVPQKPTYSKNESAGYFFIGASSSGSFNNKAGYNFSALSAKNFRYVTVSCASSLID